MNKTLLIGLFSLLLAFATQTISAQSYNADKGFEAYEKEDYKTALDYFSRHLKDSPNDAVILHTRALIYDYYEEYARALSDINNSIKHYSKKDKEVLAKAYKLRASIYAETDEIDKAFDDLNTALKMNSTDISVLIDRADLYYKQKNYAKSNQDLETILKIDESEVTAYARIGRNYLMQEQYNEAIKLLTKAIKLSPNYTWALGARARAYEKLDNTEDAISDLLEVLTIEQSDKFAYRELMILSEKHSKIILSKLSTLIRKNAEDDFWYYFRGSIYETIENYDKAIADYNKALELLNYNNASIFYRLGYCYKEKGDYDTSIDNYDKAIAIAPEDEDFYAYRADAKRLKGDFDSAIADFTKAIEIEPSWAWAYYRRGWTKEFVKQYEKALEDYNEAIEIDPNYTYAFLNRARLLELMNKQEEAKADYEIVVLQDSVIRHSGNSKQYALFHLGKKDEAIDWLNKILEKYPTYGNQYDAACLYSIMKENELALKYLDLAFENGYKDFHHIQVDDDMDNIRELPEFKALIKKYESLKESSENVSSNKLVEKTAEIKMTKKGGVYEVPCKINGLALNFIFDTGASDVTISSTEAQFMYKNKYLEPQDILGKQRYQIANGEIEEGTKIRLKQIEIGTLTLKNVNASVVHNQQAPLLLGQSALNKFGKVEIDNKNSLLNIRYQEIEK
jgi:clan AA aspartic protease (TIGR02281 family)